MELLVKRDPNTLIETDGKVVTKGDVPDFLKVPMVVPQEQVERVDKRSKNDDLLIVDEREVENAKELVQNRIAIDRFTGGAYYGALFEEQALFGNEDTRVTLSLELRQPENYEIGLLLLLLKDLWTSDLPVGGQSSIGRGRLQGIKAVMSLYRPEKESQTFSMFWIKQNGEQLKIRNAKTLEDFVNDLVSKKVKND